MIYNEFVEKAVNPKTGCSTFLDRGYYTSEPKYTNIVLQKIADTKRMDKSILENQILQNTKQVFKKINQID